MKKIVGIFLIMLSSAAFADNTAKVPDGSTITATADGPGRIKISWGGFKADAVIRYHLVESSSDGRWTSKVNAPGKFAVIESVCASNDKFKYDARFQLWLTGGHYLAIWPTGVQRATLRGIHQQIDSAGSNTYALEVDESVLQQACGSPAPQQ